MSEQVMLDGPDGRIEIFVDSFDVHDAHDVSAALQGIAIVAHPHPLFGGTADNKVVTTLAKTLRSLGYVTLRPSFRGVGKSEGVHDHGFAETADLLAVHDYARQRFGKRPVVLAGFSFGAYVITRLARELAARGEPAERLVLVGTAAGYIEGAREYAAEAVAADTIVIHGSADETVPLANVVAWAEPLELPITLVPGADHFFHRKLHLIRNIIHSAWHRQIS